MSDDIRTITLGLREGRLEKHQYGESFCGVKTKNLWLTVVRRDSHSVTVSLPHDFERLPALFVEDRKKKGFTKKKKPIVRALEGKPIQPKKSWLKKFNSTPTQTRRFPTSAPNQSGTPKNA